MRGGLDGLCGRRRTGVMPLRLPARALVAPPPQLGRRRRTGSTTGEPPLPHVCLIWVQLGETRTLGFWIWGKIGEILDLGFRVAGEFRGFLDFNQNWPNPLLLLANPSA